MKKIALTLTFLTAITVSACTPAENNSLSSSPSEQEVLTTVASPEVPVSEIEEAPLPILTNRTTSVSPDSLEGQEPYVVECIPEGNGDAKMSDGSVIYQNECFDSSKKDEVLKEIVYDGKDPLETPIGPYGGHLSTGQEVFPLEHYNTAYSARTHHECLEGKNDNESICDSIFDKYGSPEQVLK